MLLKEFNPNWIMGYNVFTDDGNAPVVSVNVVRPQYPSEVCEVLVEISYEIEPNRTISYRLPENLICICMEKRLWTLRDFYTGDPKHSGVAFDIDTPIDDFIVAENEHEPFNELWTTIGRIPMFLISFPTATVMVEQEQEL